MTPPILQAFELDVNASTLVLVFDEALSITTINVTQITLQNTRNIDDATSVYSLITSTVIDTLSNELTIFLSTEDLDAIKVAEDFGSSSTDTFVSFPSSFGMDYGDNTVISVSNRSAVAANVIVMDQTPPQLESFTLDLDQGTLNVSFNEPVNISAINFPGVTLLSGALIFPLTSGDVLPPNRRDFTITLTPEDLNSAKTILSNFLAIDSGAIVDIAGNGIEQILPIDAIRGTDFVPDTTPPQLQAFDFKMDNGTLPLYIILYFDEVIDVSTLDPSTLTIHVDTSDNVTNAFNLAAAIPENTDIETMVRITLLESDTNAIRELPPLGQTNATIFLSVQDNLVSDVSNQVYSSDGAPLSVNVFTADLVKPAFSAFTFDLDAGRIHLTFSEDIVTSSYNSSSLLLLGSQSIAGPVVIPSDAEIFF